MKKNFDEYKKALENVWKKDGRMVDYCMKETDNVVRLDNGWLIPVEKEHLKKDFCFGYSLSRYDSDDYDRANEMARYASESEDYFVTENMASFRELMKDISDDDLFVGVATKYISGGENLKSVHFFRGWEVCDAFGGSCYLDKVSDSDIEYRGTTYHILSDADREKVKEGVAEAMKNHEKRVNTYLKKYGTKHVNTWSYWQDA